MPFIQADVDTPDYDPTKYDVLLGKYGYRIRSLSLDSAPSLVPRFNTGEQGENDLDMLKIDGNDNYLGGMFQPEFSDPTMASTIINGYVNPDNERLYPTPEHQTLHTFTTAEGNMTASTIYKGSLFVAIRGFDVTWKNTMWQIDTDNTVTEITLPAVLADGGEIFQLHWPRATDLDVMLIMTGNVNAGGVVIHQYDGTTVTAQTGLARFASSLRNNVYVWNDHGNLFQWDVDETKWINITKMGPADEVTNPPTSLREFNYRLWGGMPTGMYTFDGVSSAKFIEAESQVADNCQYTAVMHGWMYFNMDGYVWRHNSITVERLRDFRDTKIIGITAGNDRVWVVTEGGPGNGVIDKEGWNVDDTNLWGFDSVGWFLYNNNQTGPTISDYVTFFNQKVYTHFVGGTDGVASTLDVIDLSQEWQTGAKEPMLVIGSEMDNNFPNVDKYLESIEIDYEDIHTGDNIVVSYRTRSDTGVWSSWTQNDKNITSVSPNTKRFFVTEYKLMQYRFVVLKDASSELSLESAKIHYAVQPESRKRWRASLVCAGADYYNSEVLKDGVEETLTPKQLRDNIYSVERRVIPSIFMGPDYCILDAFVNEVQLGDITVRGTTNTMRDRGTIYMNGELMNYDGKTETTLNLTKRGAWGTTPVSHDKDSKLGEFYRVFIENIVNEQFLLNDAEANLYRENPDYGLESIITVQITEVNVEHEN